MNPTPAAPARQRVEHIIAISAAASRLVALVFVITDIAADPRQLDHPLESLTFGLTVVESVALAAACLYTGVLRRAWASSDAAFLAAVLVVCALPSVTGTAPGISPLYNFSTVAVLVGGLADWPLPAGLAAAGLVAAANIGTAVAAGEQHYPLWNAVPNSLALLGAAVVAWVIARVLRRTARTLDAYRDAAVRRAAALASERERVRQSLALGAELMSTLEDLSASPEVLEPALREQLVRELAWLRAVVAGVPIEGVDADRDPSDLGAALRALVAEKAALGLRVRLAVAVAVAEQHLGASPLPASHVAALVGAAREALSNVSKHAGTAVALVRVDTTAETVQVEVVDAGCGYDARQQPLGTGQRRSIEARLAEVGGGAAIDSTPGRGTTVRLWAPVGAIAHDRSGARP